MWETRVRSLGQEDPLEKGMATHSSILACRIPWTEEPSGLQSVGSQRVRHDWTTNTLSLSLYIQRRVLIPYHPKPSVAPDKNNDHSQPQPPLTESLTHASYSVPGSKLRLVGEILNRVTLGCLPAVPPCTSPTHTHTQRHTDTHTHSDGLDPRWFLFSNTNQKEEKQMFSGGVN